MANNWTREEHILAFNLYNRIPFGKTHKANPEVIKLAKLIGRTPSSIGMKLGNFARLDPALQARGIKGLSNGAKGEVDIWDEFKNSPEDLIFESEELMASKLNTDLTVYSKIKTDDLQTLGKERHVIVKQRVNQKVFRDRILSAYDYKCCVTGLAIPQLLVAGHIIPWSQDVANRLNPQNGLCLNMLHDKAFDRGLITIANDFTVKYSKDFIEQSKENSAAYEWLMQYCGRKLILQKGFEPSSDFLKCHREGNWR
jgi:putative restriction endonuclease